MSYTAFECWIETCKTALLDNFCHPFTCHLQKTYSLDFGMLRSPFSLSPSPPPTQRIHSSCLIKSLPLLNSDISQPAYRNNTNNAEFLGEHLFDKIEQLNQKQVSSNVNQLFSTFKPCFTRSTCPIVHTIIICLYILICLNVNDTPANDLYS